MDELLPNLNPRPVISVQAMLPDGAAATRFDVPLNEFDIRHSTFVIPPAPGEKAMFFSFNHAAGRWDVSAQHLQACPGKPWPDCLSLVG